MYTLDPRHYWKLYVEGQLRDVAAGYVGDISDVDVRIIV